MNDKDETQPKDAVPDLSGMLGLGGIFEGVSNLINKFGELAEKGESLRTAVNQSETSTGKQFTSSYGVNVQFGLGKHSKLGARHQSLTRLRLDSDKAFAVKNRFLS